MIKKLVRKNILNLTPYSSARDEYKANSGIFLDANEYPAGDYNRYPDPYQNKLKNELAQLKKCPNNQIFIGNGSDEIIDLAFRIFCEPYIDKAISFTPGYGMYKVAADIQGAAMIEIPLNERFQLDKNGIKPYFNDPHIKIIFVCSPNNPTGNLILKEDILWLLNNFNGIIIVDEAYIDFSDQTSMISELENYPKLIVLQTLSKGFGMAGLRIGVGYLNSELLAIFNKVKTPYNVSDANQKLALKELKNMNLKIKTENINREKEKLIRCLNTLTCVEKIYPSDANFLLIKFKNAEEIFKNLLQQGVIVRNRSSQIENCLRISIGTSDENQKLIKIFNQIQNESTVY